MLLCLPEGKHETPVGAGFSGEPHEFVSADTRHKPLFGNQGNQGKVLNLDHLDFDIVSNFGFRASHFTSPRPFTTVESPLQIRLFMQNKAKFRKSQMNVTSLITADYEKKTLGERGKKQSQTNPNKANFQKAKMNVNKALTKDYENISNWAICENKPNINPKQSQTKPISEEKNAALHLYAVGYLRKK